MDLFSLARDNTPRGLLGTFLFARLENALEIDWSCCDCVPTPFSRRLASREQSILPFSNHTVLPEIGGTRISGFFNRIGRPCLPGGVGGFVKPRLRRMFGSMQVTNAQRTEKALSGVVSPQ